jgi:hypothetical protein
MHIVTRILIKRKNVDRARLCRVKSSINRSCDPSTARYGIHAPPGSIHPRRVTSAGQWEWGGGMEPAVRGAIPFAFTFSISN